MDPADRPVESGTSSSADSQRDQASSPAGAAGPGAQPIPPGPDPAAELDEVTAKEVDMMMDDLAVGDMDAVYGAAPKGPARTKEGVQSCKVVMISGDDVFVDMGMKNQGVVPRQQFGDQPPEVGQYVDLVLDYYDSGAGLLVMSKEGAVKAASWATLEEGLIVEGRVTGMNKGGLEVDLKGIRAFMPASQVDIGRMHDISTLIGEQVRCMVIEVDRSDQNVLVSRRKCLEKEQAEQREQLFETLNEGDTVTGKVARITDFGAFVDLGGVDGLLHIKDLSYGRVDKVSNVVKVGETVEVKVLRVDAKRERISLGLKQVKPDPWSDVDQKYLAGMLVKVRVTQLAKFGAFAELEEGVEGLIPLSEMSRLKRINRPEEVVKSGDIVEVKILRVDPKERRISLSIKELEEDPWAGAIEHFPSSGKVTGKVTRLADFGAFVELRPGVEGLIHISELSEKRVRTVGEVVAAGQEVEVRVLGVDPDKRRISLSLKPAPEDMAAESADFGKAAKPRKRKTPLRGGLAWQGLGESGDLHGLEGLGG